MALEICEVIDVKSETPTVKIIKIKAQKNYRPGQFFNLYLAENPKSTNLLEFKQARPYSLISSPTNKEYLEIAFKVAGNFTQKLATLKHGDNIGVNGPFGFFTIDEALDKYIVMLAGGIGITPFVSTLRYATEKKLSNKFLLFYSCKYKNDFPLHEELKSLTKQNKNIKCIFTLTQETSAGFEHGRINEMLLKKYISDFREKVFYVCGTHDFIQSTVALLEKLGIDKKKIKKEDFGFVKKPT